MNKVFATFCIVGTALVLSACGTGYTFDSGASYATDRTAGTIDGKAQERVFRDTQTK